MGQVGKEAANGRGPRRALPGLGPAPGRPNPEVSYGEALEARRLGRLKFPDPANGLRKEEEWAWRRLQTDTFVPPGKLHMWYPAS